MRSAKLILPMCFLAALLVSSGLYQPLFPPSNASNSDRFPSTVGVLPPGISPDVKRITAEQQDAIVQDALNNLWKYRSVAAAAQVEPRQVQAQNGQIAYVGEDGFLRFMNADGTGQQLVVETLSNIASLAWSANNQYLAFAADGETGRCLYKLRAYDPIYTELACGFTELLGPRWSPDGTRLVFMGRQAGDVSYRSWSLTADGNDLTKLGPQLDQSWLPSWIDNDTIVVPGENPANIFRLYTIDLSNPSQPHSITPEFRCTDPCVCNDSDVWIGNPDPAPDGQNIAFLGARTEGDKNSCTAYYALYLVDPAGAANPRKVTDLANTSQGFAAVAGPVHWSPDQQRIGVYASGNDGRLRLNLVDPIATTNNLTVLHGREGGDQIDFEWSPDAAQLAAGYRYSNSSPELVEINPATDRFTTLAVGAYPAWSSSVNAGLAYVGPMFVYGNSPMVLEEEDHKITMGDHVHLKLNFLNTSDQVLTNASVVVAGSPASVNLTSVTVFGATGSNISQTFPISPSVIPAHSIGYADFWVFFENKDFSERQTLVNPAWLSVTTENGDWLIQFPLAPIEYLTTGPEASLTVTSCLHNPNLFPIEAYAQYAAANSSPFGALLPSNNSDADSLESAVGNLVSRVGNRAEFNYNDSMPNGDRVPDLTLLDRRGGDIGVCRHYADLATGLLRSLNISTRIVAATLVESSTSKPIGHFWTETYVNGNWRQADPTWQRSFTETIYLLSGMPVREAWADNYPLSSASIYVNDRYRCIHPCYADPANCSDCLSRSNNLQFFFGLGCVDDVTNKYGLVHGTNSANKAQSVNAQSLQVSLVAPANLTRTVPFSASINVTNTSPNTIGPITATIGISEFVDSNRILFAMEPEYRTIDTLASGNTISLAWTIVPLVTQAVPLRVGIASTAEYTVIEQAVLINEFNTLPDLSLTEGCSSHVMHPGRPFTLTTTILNHLSELITDTSTLITATFYSTPTIAYSTTVNLTYCEACGYFQYVMTLPDDAPLGDFLVDFTASHPGYDPAHTQSVFFVAPSLTMTLKVDQSWANPWDQLTIRGRVYERGTVISGANTLAEIATPTGVFTVPLIFDGDTYKASFRPKDAAPNLNNLIASGHWTIRATAEYLGSITTATATLVIPYRTYLPLIAHQFDARLRTYLPLLLRGGH